MADTHIAQMVLDRAKAKPQGVAFRTKKDGTNYADVTWSEVVPRIAKPAIRVPAASAPTRARVERLTISAAAR